MLTHVCPAYPVHVRRRLSFAMAPRSLCGPSVLGRGGSRSLLHRPFNGVPSFPVLCRDRHADALAKKLVDVDYSSRYGIVATAGSDLKIVGHAMYVKTEPRKAELALAVADEYQGRGLGTILLGQLAEAAATAGIDVLEAVVKPKNHRMRITPITRGEAARMIRSLKTFPLLDGYRGAPGPTCVRWRTCSCA